MTRRKTPMWKNIVDEGITPMQNQEETTRIILANGSPFLHEVLYKAINKQEKLQVVAEVRNLNRYSKVAKQIKADWTYLLLPPGEEIPDAVEEVMKEQDSMRLLIMATDGSNVRVKWVEHHDHDLQIDELKQIFSILEDKGLETESRFIKNKTT